MLKYMYNMSIDSIKAVSSKPTRAVIIKRLNGAF